MSPYCDRHDVSVAFGSECPLCEMGSGGRPTVVTLCGSTRFYQEYQRAYFEETLAGRIVLSVGFYPHASQEVHGQNIGIDAEQKRALDALHLRKIEMSDEILVLNVGGYVGDSTRREIEHATKLGKRVRWLEPAGSASEEGEGDG